MARLERHVWSRNSSEAETQVKEQKLVKKKAAEMCYGELSFFQAEMGVGRKMRDFEMRKHGRSVLRGVWRWLFGNEIPVSMRPRNHHQDSDRDCPTWFPTFGVYGEVSRPRKVEEGRCKATWKVDLRLPGR